MLILSHSIENMEIVAKIYKFVSSFRMLFRWTMEISPLADTIVVWSGSGLANGEVNSKKLLRNYVKRWRRA
jgi:hypothetical protein